MLKAIIFDMDGVLLDSERLWPEIEFERYRKLIPGWTREHHKLLTGLSLNDSYRMFVDKFNLDMRWEEYDGFYRKMAGEVYLQLTKFYPGAEEMLEELKEQGIPMGLATSSPNYWLDIIYERFPLKEYLDCIMGADDVGGKGKPSPDLYVKVINEMRLIPEECVAIEDSLNGIVSAKRAGLFAMGFRNGHNGDADLSEADMEIEGFTPKNRKRIMELVGGGE